MKTKMIITLMLILSLSGCGFNNSTSPPSDASVLTINTENANNNNNDELTELHSLPDIIELSFNHLEMNELQEGDAAADWHYMS